MFFKKLQKLLKSRNLTQKQFCVNLGIQEGVVSRWASNSTQPSTKSVSKICKYFGVSPSYFYDEDDLIEKVYESTNNSYRIDLIEEKIKRLEVEIENLKLRGK